MAGDPNAEDGPDVESSRLSLAQGQLHGEHCIQTDQDTLQSYAVYATKPLAPNAPAALNMGPGVRIVGGNVGVRDPNEPVSPLLFQLVVGDNAKIDATKTTFAKDVRLVGGGGVVPATVGALKTDIEHLDQQSGATVGPLSAFPSTTPIPYVVAEATVATSAMGDRLIPANAVPPALAPDAYRDIVVGDGATLQLAGGTYAFRRLTMAKNSQLIANAATTITVNELITIGESARIAPVSPLTAQSLIIRAAAGFQGTNMLGEIPALRFGQATVVRALIIAPAAHVRWFAFARLRGAIIARSVQWLQGNPDSAAPASVIYEDGIPGEDCQPYDCSGPAVEDGDPCTVYQCTAELGPQQVPGPDGTACDFNGEPGACLAGTCEELCNGDTQQITGDPYHNVIVPASEPTPAGLYLVKYVTGCMKYNPLWWWSVNAVEDGEFTWFLMEAGNKTVLPGTFGFFNNINGGPTARDKPGFPTQAECIAANMLQPPKVVDHAGNDLMGIKLFDHPYTDNRTGPMGLRPVWSLTPFAPPNGPACGN